jgi:alpha-kinase
MTYQSHLTDIIATVDGFGAPQRFLEEMHDFPLEISPEERIASTNLARKTIYEANLVKYHPIDNQWHYQRTLVYVEDILELGENKRGSIRDINFLHQEEKKGQYLGKRYRKQVEPLHYHDDVIIHQISRYYLKLFNQALQPFPDLANQVQMVPVVHLEILMQGRVIEILNAEPYIHGEFRKMTNNNTFFVNKNLDTDILLAFSHFTWFQSFGKLMVTDLQGWVFADDKNVPVILTDPAINSPEMKNMGLTNMSSKGLDSFWKVQHKDCNHICHKLGLRRYL